MKLNNIRKIKLQDIITDIAAGPFGSNLKVECFVKDGFPIIDGANLKGIKVTDNITKFVTEEKAQSLYRSIARRGDVVVTISGNVGQIAYIPNDSLYEKYLVSQRQFRVSFNTAEADVPYLVYYFHTQEGQHKILSFVNQTGVPALAQPLKNFRNIEIDLPDLGTQKKIAKILSALDDKIECNNQINKNLEEQAKKIFKEWFIDNSENASWKRGNFSDLITSTLSGDWGKDELSGNNTEKVYCVRGADIPEVKTGNKGKMPVRYIIPKNLKSKQLEDGDIVVEISGGSPSQSTGRSTVITQSLLDRCDSSIVCTNFCKALKPVKEYSMFIYYYFQYLYDKNIFFSYENGTTGIKNLDLTGFLETESIVIPPKNLIDDFNKFCTSSFNLIFANGKESENLSNIRDSLLPKLMSGELDVSDIDI